MKVKQNKNQEDITKHFCDLVYSDISERINKLMSHHLLMKYGEVNDFSLLSKVIRNKRDPKRNPYLLGLTLVEQITNLESVPYSPYELVWGKGKQRKQLLKRLFIHGIYFLLLSSDHYKEVGEALASDFKFATTEDALNNYYYQDFDFVKEPLNRSQRDIFKDKNSNILVKSEIMKAIDHLYKFLEPTFLEYHKRYFSRKIRRKYKDQEKKYAVGTYKLDKNINQFWYILYKMITVFNEANRHRALIVLHLSDLVKIVTKIDFNDNLEEILNIDGLKIETSKIGRNNNLELMDSNKTSLNTKKLGNEFLNSIVKDQKRLESKKNYFENESFKIKQDVLRKIRI